MVQRFFRLNITYISWLHEEVIMGQHFTPVFLAMKLVLLLSPDDPLPFCWEFVSVSLPYQLSFFIALSKLR